MSELGLNRLLREGPRILSDLLVVFVYLLLMDAVFVSGRLDGPILVVLGLPLLVYVPGYSVVAALFPRRLNDADARPFAGVSRGALSTLERTLLSFGVSIALLPPVGIAIDRFNGGFATPTILLAVNSLVVVSVVIAAVRRFQLLESGSPYESRLHWVARHLSDFSPNSRLDAVLTVTLLVVAVVATSALAIALVAPSDGETYTSVALLTENETGDLTISGYPSSLARGTTESMVVVVQNHEGRSMDYTLVGELQRVNRTNGSIEVVEAAEVARTSRTVAGNGTWRANVSVSPSLTGDDLRLVFMVYRGDPTADPRIATADERVHLWVDVSD